MSVRRGYAAAVITAPVVIAPTRVDLARSTLTPGLRTIAVLTPTRAISVQGQQHAHRSLPRASNGFSLLEVTIVVVISGLLLQAVITGQELIQNARVRHIISQQDAVETAFEAFQDRFRAPPGDYNAASVNIDCGAAPCSDGNGNGHIEAGVGGAPHEEILAWQHLGAAGFLEGPFYITGAGNSSPSPGNTPRNIFGGYLEIGYDNLFGYSGNASPRHTIKTGNHVPASVLAEVDRKADDNKPGSGRFQFSTYAADGAAPPIGGSPTGCTDADTPTAAWIARDGSDNCGAATLVR